MSKIVVNDFSPLVNCRLFHLTSVATTISIKLQLCIYPRSGDPSNGYKKNCGRKRPHFTWSGNRLQGLYLGPFWYYFSLPAYIIGQGDPQAFINLVIISLYLAALFLASKVSRPLATLLLLSPPILSTTRFWFNANFTPTLTIVYFSLLWTNTSPFLIGIISGLILQSQAALGVFFLPFTLIYWLNIKKPRFVIATSLGFFITLIPQLIFELKHGFTMTHTFIQNTLNPSGNLLNITERTLAHYQSFKGLFNTLWPMPTNWLFIAIFSLLVIFMMKNKFMNRIWLSCVSFIIFCFIGYTFYPRNLTHWFLFGLYIPILTIYLLPVVAAISHSNRLIRALGLTCVIFIIVSSLTQSLATVRSQLADSSDDPSNLRNQLTTIDLVYQSANNQPFSVYSFVPSIYDFQWQYLFWWYGQLKYGYLPAIMTYRRDVPYYLPSRLNYFSSAPKINSTSPIFIIYDTTNYQAAINWLNYFSDFCLQSEKNLPWRTTFQIRTSCSTD